MLHRGGEPCGGIGYDRSAALLAGVLALPVFALLPALPAFAATHVICVGSPGGTCNQTVATIPLAINAANGNAVDDIISVGAGKYSDGPYVLDGTAHALTLEGVGPTTIITLPASATTQIYVNAHHATVSNLTIEMAPTTSLNDYGLDLFTGSAADHVVVDGAGTVDADGAEISQSTVTSSAILMPTTSASESRAVFSTGGNTVTDSTFSGWVGYFLSDPGAVDRLSRDSMSVGYQGVTVDGGTIDIDDSVADLGTGSGSGLVAANPNPGTEPKTINADHVTVVGGGTGSVGVKASSEWATVSQTSTVRLTDSIISGPATSLLAEASNNGSPGSNSSSTITASYSDYQSTGGVIGAHGSGGVVVGAGDVDVDPHFVDAAAANYHLAPGSPVVDKGDPAAGGPAKDRDGHARVTDGDGNGSKIGDMGAYERPGLPDTVAPNTKITGHPRHRVDTAKVKVAFASTEPGSRFQCKLDQGAYKPCTSPAKVYAKKGRHVFEVRAIDLAGNVDPSPAELTFKRVAKQGQHHH